VTHYLVRQLCCAVRVWIVQPAKRADQLPEHRPDVIPLDRSMPAIHGFEFGKHFRQNVSLAVLPILVLTLAILNPEAWALLTPFAATMSKAESTPGPLIDAIQDVRRTAAGIDAE
jgi:CheY-like chemotaxis protein